MTGNKLRLYLGYWRRQTTETNPGKFHVGLLVVPKKPNNDGLPARRYHAVNPIDQETGLETWKFEVLRTGARTNKLAGVMLLGKVPPSFTMEDIEEILKKVFVPTPAQTATITWQHWRCRHWVLDAIELLATEGVIPTLPSSTQEMWDKGRAFVENETVETNGYPVRGEWLYTCDTSGTEITSEIKPF